MDIILDKIFILLHKPSSILIILLMTLVFSTYVLKIKYIDCFSIFINHVNNFRDDNNKFLIMPFTIYFIVPLIISLQLANIRPVSSNVIQIIFVITPILISMFFIILALLIYLKNEISQKQLDGTTYIIIKSVIKETYYTVMFEIMINVFILILCFISMFCNQFSYLENMLLYYLIFVLIINLLMVLKRISKLIDKNMNL